MRTVRGGAGAILLARPWPSPRAGNSSTSNGGGAMAEHPNAGTRRRSGAGPWIALALTCLGLAALDRTLVRDAVLTLGATHREVVEADVTSSLREIPGAEPRVQRLRLRRTDEVLVTSGEVAVFQSTLTWIGSVGPAPLSQTTGLYGVHRRDRGNVAGFGDQERDGAFAPPPDPPRGRLLLWDSFHPGPLAFDFETVEQRDGLTLLRYRLAREPADPVDASSTYERLPLVPERYRVRTRVEAASLLVEPRTGRIVDREQRAESWYTTADDPTPLGDAQRWSWRYSVEDRARLLAETRDQLRRLAWVERVMPGVLLALAAGAAALALRRRRPPAAAGRG